MTSNESKEYAPTIAVGWGLPAQTKNRVSRKKEISWLISILLLPKSAKTIAENSFWENVSMNKNVYNSCNVYNMSRY